MYMQATNHTCSIEYGWSCDREINTYYVRAANSAVQRSIICNCDKTYLSLSTYLSISLAMYLSTSLPPPPLSLSSGSCSAWRLYGTRLRYTGYWGMLMCSWRISLECHWLTYWAYLLAPEASALPSPFQSCPLLSSVFLFISPNK